jgi:predicted O-methyltransferase YrrM
MSLFSQLSPALQTYLTSVSAVEPDDLKRLRQSVADHPLHHMQIAPEQAQLIALLLSLMGAKKVLELGVFMGYSALTIARTLPADGQLIACEINPEYGAIARNNWQLDPISSAKIDLRIAPALDTLDALIADGQTNSFDFALIDADKSGYCDYYERSLQLIRPNGLIAIDNVLWHGKVADPAVQDSRTNQIRALNQQLVGDRRVEISIIPIGDGMTLARKLTPKIE